MKFLENDMEELIIKNPGKYIGEDGLELLSRQYSIGYYRFDLLFEDRHGAKLIVEIQRGTLDRNHTYKIFDYYDEFKEQNPGEFVELMVVANKIPRERRNRLKSMGITFKEIPESIFLDDPNFQIKTDPNETNSLSHDSKISTGDAKKTIMRDNNSIYTRLIKIIGEGYGLGDHPIGGTYINFPGKGFNRICLYESEKASENTFSLEICAGDTCAQARELFKHISYAKIKNLEKDGWTIESNFHFAWQRKNVLFTKGDKSLALSRYIEYWIWALDNKHIRQYNRTEFDSLLKELVRANIMDDLDIEKFNEFFRTNNYQSIITCPGIINRINYPKERLNEDVESLAVELKEKMNGFLATLNNDEKNKTKNRINISDKSQIWGKEELILIAEDSNAEKAIEPPGDATKKTIHFH
jgi:hypothetical protein